MKRFVLTVTGALTLLMLLSGSALAAAPHTGKAGKATKPPTVASSAVGGQPALDKDKDFGYYIWFDGSHFQLRTTDRGNGPSPSVYTGKIVAHGSKGQKPTITDVTPLRLEAKDSAVASGDKLDFHFTTYNATDGVGFAAPGAKSVTFKLYRDGHLVAADHIHLGQGEGDAPGDPFTITVG